MVKALQTLGAPKIRTTFGYTGSISDGVILEQKNHPSIDAQMFREALRHFAGQTIRGGFKMDDPPANGFGAWVQNESKRLNSRQLGARHGSFIAAILCS